MTYGIRTITAGGIDQISEYQVFYRVASAGTYGYASYSDATPLGGGPTYFYNIAGDCVGQGKLMFINGPAGTRLLPARYGGPATYFVGDPTSRIGIENNGAAVNVLVADYLDWPAPSGVGFTVRLPNGTVGFSTSGTLLVLATTVTVSMSAAMVGGVYYVDFNTSPFGGTPYLHFSYSTMVLKTSETTAKMYQVTAWFTSGSQLAFQLITSNSTTFSGDFSSRPTSQPYTFTIAMQL